MTIQQSRLAFVVAVAIVVLAYRLIRNRRVPRLFLTGTHRGQQPGLVDGELGPICAGVHCSKAAGGHAGAVGVEVAVQDVLAGGLRDCFRRHDEAVIEQVQWYSSIYSVLQRRIEEGSCSRVPFDFACTFKL